MNLQPVVGLALAAALLAEGIGVWQIAGGLLVLSGTPNSPWSRVISVLMAPTPILILPGYADSGPDHWQSHWERADPAARRVVQDDWLAPRREDWLRTLERYVAECAAPPVLVAHSLACSLVAHWAGHPRSAAKGALLVAPADVDSPLRTPEEVRSFSPIPLARLPFPSIVVASTDDPFVSLERATTFAAAWGSRLVILGRAGHINADAGFGPWPEGRRLLDELLAGAPADDSIDAGSAPRPIRHASWCPGSQAC